MDDFDAALEFHISESQADEPSICFECKTQYGEYEDPLFGDVTVLTKHGEFPICHACELSD